MITFEKNPAGRIDLTVIVDRYPVPVDRVNIEFNRAALIDLAKMIMTTLEITLSTTAYQLSFVQEMNGIELQMASDDASTPQ